MQERLFNIISGIAAIPVIFFLRVAILNLHHNPVAWIIIIIVSLTPLLSILVHHFIKQEKWAKNFRLILVVINVIIGLITLYLVLVWKSLIITLG